MCKIGQPDRCKSLGCEWSKTFFISCAEKKLADQVMINQEAEKFSFEKIYDLSKDQKQFPLPKRKLKSSSKKQVINYDSKRRKVFARSNGICYLCGESVEFRKMSVDHVIPKSKGGSNGIENLRATHVKCNLEKGNKILENY